MERAFILPPEGQIGTITFEERNAMIKGSLLYKFYAQGIDKSSAYEKLNEKEEEKARKTQEKEEQREAKERNKVIGKVASSFLVPLGRELIKSLFGKKKR